MSAPSDRIAAVSYALDARVERWNTTAAAPITLTYQFAGSSPPPAMSDYGYSGWTAFTAMQQDAVRSVFAELGSVMNVNFSEVTSGAADIDLGRVSLGDSGQGGFEYGFSTNGSGQVVSKSLYGFAVWASSLDLTVQDNRAVLLHELGHALTLKHPGPYNSGGGNIPPGPYLPLNEDTNKYTVMSYTWNADNGLNSDHLMLYDIAALQARFGANTHFRTGADVYTGPAGGRIQTIWDAGGIDTFDGSSNGSGNTINLNEGAFSSIGALNNLAIAYDVVIENAIGGAGADILTGNGANNSLTGNGGSDRLTGAGGNDFLDGGAGFDTAVFSNARSLYAIGRLGAATTVTGADGTDTLSGIECLQFSDVLISAAHPRPLTDFNGDGRTDLVWRNAQTGTTEVLLMNGVNYIGYLDFNWSTQWRVLSAAGDFNGDGRSDLVWRNTQTGTVEVLLMNGVNAGGYRDFAYTTQWEVLTAGADFNADGKSDLVWRNNVTGTVEVTLMDGVNATSYRDYTYSTQWTILTASADFNADGRNDLVWSNDTAGITEIMLMDGVHSTAYSDYAWTQWRVVSAAGDFNGDRRNDLVWRNTVTGTVEVLLMDGVGGTSYRDYAWSTQWEVLSAAGDFNGDGKSDLVWRNNVTGTIEVVLMDGVNLTGYRDYAWGTQWEVINATADFNADGKSDLVWHNTATGTVEVALMDGVNIGAYQDYAWGTAWQALNVAPENVIA